MLTLTREEKSSTWASVFSFPTVSSYAGVFYDS